MSENAVRITIMLDKNNQKHLKKIQAKLIITSPSSVSFSNVTNQVLEEGLKKFKV